MGAATDRLTEPHVLAGAKGRLFPDGDESRSYAVADVQFATEEWLPGEPIEPAIHERLAPFNRVQVGAGYPDLVGVRALEPELLAVERFGEEPPLIAVEAKGHAGSGVDTTGGIVQAYDRLHGANAAYLAAPAGAVSATDRTLARELNVGILAVSADGAVEPVERPRIVGNRTSDEATAVRFRASVGGVAEQSFGLNHPKNYLAYPLAVAGDGPTAELVERWVVGATDDARRGAAFLGLIESGRSAVDARGPRLTELGREVVRFGVARHGSPERALAEFDGWRGSRKRFVDLAPAWGQLARRVVFAYPATELLVTELQALFEDGVAEPTLVTLLEYLHELHPAFAVELFLRGEEGVRRRVLTPEGELRRVPLEDGEVYHAPTVFQLKAMLYHAGILTERGREPHRLEPTEDVWALREPV